MATIEETKTCVRLERAALQSASEAERLGLQVQEAEVADERLYGAKEVADLKRQAREKGRYAAGLRVQADASWSKAFPVLKDRIAMKKDVVENAEKWDILLR